MIYIFPSAADSTELDKLQKHKMAQDEAHAAQLASLKWQLRREQERCKQLQIDLKQAATVQKSAHADLEHERIMRQIDLEQMSQKAIEIAQDAVVPTTEAAAMEHSVKIAEMLAKNAQSKRKHDQQVKELEATVARATSNLHRLQSTVATMLEETRVACEMERLESEVILENRHREELGKLRSTHRQEKKQLDQEKLNATAELFRRQHRAAVAAQQSAEEISGHSVRLCLSVPRPLAAFSSRLY